MDDSSTMESSVPFWRRLYEGWLVIAAHFGEVQTLIVVSLVYLLGIGPMSVIVALTRRDLLHKRALRGPDSAWQDADTVSSPDLERAKRLF
jgi:hypothetical protein